MTQKEKEQAVKEFTELVSSNILTFFKMMELETHIESMIINGDEQYILQFRKLIDGKLPESTVLK